jgi:glycosyltransferase involved in cell wall biosynthesis
MAIEESVRLAGAIQLVPEAAEIDLSLIIPAYNEGVVIRDVLEGFRAVLRNIPVATELILVDDASLDGTAAQASQVEGVRVLRNPRNLGYGHSLLRGMQVARGRYFAIADADGSYPADCLPRLWRYVEEGADHVIGARSGKHLTSHFGLRSLYRALCHFVTGERVPDANSGLRIFDRRVVETLRGDLCRGFSFTTSLTLASLMSGFVVVFHPIPFHERAGHSHVHRIRDTLRTAQYLIQLIAVYNPLKLFLPLVLLSVIIGLAGFAYGWLYRSPWGALTGLLASATTPLLCGLAALAYIIARTGNKPEHPLAPAQDGDDSHVH